MFVVVDLEANPQRRRRREKQPFLEKPRKDGIAVVLVQLDSALDGYFAPKRGARKDGGSPGAANEREGVRWNHPWFPYGSYRCQEEFRR